MRRRRPVCDKCRQSYFLKASEALNHARARWAKERCFNNRRKMGVGVQGKNLQCNEAELRLEHKGLL